MLANVREGGSRIARLQVMNWLNWLNWLNGRCACGYTNTHTRSVRVRMNELCSRGTRWEFLHSSSFDTHMYTNTRNVIRTRVWANALLHVRACRRAPTLWLVNVVLHPGACSRCSQHLCMPHIYTLRQQYVWQFKARLKALWVRGQSNHTNTSTFAHSKRSTVQC